MNWTTLGMKILSNLPKIQQVVETIGKIKGLPGQDKATAVIQAVGEGNDIAEDVLSKQLLSHPKVQTALRKVNDANVEFQNVLADVTRELAQAVP